MLLRLTWVWGCNPCTKATRMWEAVEYLALAMVPWHQPLLAQEPEEDQARTSDFRSNTDSAPGSARA